MACRKNSPGKPCCCTSDDLPEITIAGMTASAPWGRYGADKCCWIRTYTQNTTQPEVLVDYGPLVEASSVETEIWDAAEFYHFRSVVEVTPGCFANDFAPRKIIGGRVTHTITRTSNLYFGVKRQARDVTIIIGHIPIACPDDTGPTKRWSITVLQDGLYRALKRTKANVTEVYSWSPTSNVCGWNPTYTESSTTTGSALGPTDAAFWNVNPFTDPAQVAFRTSKTTVLDVLPTGEYHVIDCMNTCTSCVDITCNSTVVTGTPGTVASCTPYDQTIYYCPGIHQQQPACGECTEVLIERTTDTALGSLDSVCILFPGNVTTFSSSNTAAALSASFSCSAGSVTDCSGYTTAITVSGTSTGAKDWVSRTKTCDTIIHSYVSVDVTFAPITLVFP